MKQYHLMALVAALLVAVLAAPTNAGLFDRFRQDVEDQKARDREKREEVLRTTRAFMTSINGRLQAAGVRTRVESPIDTTQVNNISTNQVAHVPPAIRAIAATPRVYGEVIGMSQPRIYSSPSLGSPSVGRVKRGEIVEVVVRSDDKEVQSNKRAFWYFVRRVNEDFKEGWLFGGYLMPATVSEPEDSRDNGDSADNTAQVNPGTPDAVPVTPPPTDPTLQQADMKYARIVVDDVLNMRNQPSTDGEVVAPIPGNEIVEVLGQGVKKENIGGRKAYWYKIRRINVNNAEGWIFGGFIARSETATPPAPAPGTTNSDFIVPTSGQVSSAFGYRSDPVTGAAGQFHSGIDLAAPMGTPVKATADALVEFAGWNAYGYGNLIMLKHDADLASWYGHLSAVKCTAGQNVKKGDLIGNVGSTGYSTGPHLHFEIRKGQTAVDPNGYIR